MNEEGSSSQPNQSSYKSDLGLVAALMDSLGCALVVLDLNNKIRIANSAAAALLGFCIKEARTEAFAHVVKSKRLVEWLNQSIEQGSETCALLEVGEKDGGKRRRLSVRWLSLKDEQSGQRLGGAVMIGASEAASLLERPEVEDLRSCIRHEILTPLTALRGFAELMLTRQFSEEKRRDFLQIIHDETVRVTDLLDRLLGRASPGIKPPDKA